MEVESGEVKVDRAAEAVTVPGAACVALDGLNLGVEVLEVGRGGASAIQPRLPAGWVSVGVAATPVGRTVTATAKIRLVTTKLVEFEVEAHDGVRLIGKGTHTRAPVEVARFERWL
jgi:fluoroacetyl-CoA thioesterase